MAELERSLCRPEFLIVYLFLLGFFWTKLKKLKNLAGERELTESEITLEKVCGIGQFVSIVLSVTTVVIMIN